MPRVKRGKVHTSKRRKILKKAKGYKGRRKTHLREARQAVTRAGQYAYRDRKKKKSDFRRLWNTQISAAAKEREISYNTFIKGLRDRQIQLNRKILAQLAKEEPKVFDEIVKEIKA